MGKINMDKEIWKPIEGYEGHYEVSNFGRVKSVERRARFVSKKWKRMYSKSARKNYARNRTLF